jgi:hypothetical protein
MKGTLINHSQKKILGFAWRKLCNWIKAEVGRVVDYGLDQLHIVGFKGVRLGQFTSKLKLDCEKMGFGFVEGVVVMDVGLGSRPEAGPRVSSDLGFVSLPEDALGLGRSRFHPNFLSNKSR